MSSSQFEKKQFPKIMSMSYLGQKGYSIFKKELEQSQIDFIKKELKVTETTCPGIVGQIVVGCELSLF